MEEENTVFLNALLQCETDNVLKIIGDEPHLINDVLSNKLTAFETVLKQGFSKLALKLIELPEFNLNSPEHNPVKAAIIFGYPEIAKQLLNKGANPNAFSSDSPSLLHLALERNDLSLAELLLTDLRS